MTEVIKKALNDKAWARWTALILIALAMFFAYMFVDVMSPLQSLVEKSRGWTSETFGGPFHRNSIYFINGDWRINQIFSHKRLVSSHIVLCMA